MEKDMKKLLLAAFAVLALASGVLNTANAVTVFQADQGTPQGGQQ